MSATRLARLSRLSRLNSPGYEREVIVTCCGALLLEAVGSMVERLETTRGRIRHDIAP